MKTIWTMIAIIQEQVIHQIYKNMKEILKALKDFQQEVPVILKDTQGYGYSYSDLPAIFKVIIPILGKYGMGFYQPLNGTKLKTVIFHCESGETIESETDLPFDSLVYEDFDKYDKNSKQYIKSNAIKGFEGMNRAQAIGSLITYFRRYTLSSLLGLVTDKDTDGTGFQSFYKEETKPVVSKLINNARQGKPSSIKDFEEGFVDSNTGEIIYDENYHKMNEAKKAYNREARPKKNDAYRNSVFSVTLTAVQQETDSGKLTEIKDKISKNTVMTIEQKEQIIKIIDSKLQ